MRMATGARLIVSIAMPMHNAAAFLDEALAGVEAQTCPPEQLELSLVDDASTDDTWAIALRWTERLRARGTRVVASRSPHERARGPGWATNAAVRQSSGEYVCLMDADDVSAPERVAAQLAVMREREAAAGGDGSAGRTLLGTSLVRVPPDATVRYAAWLNRLSDAELMTQRFVECTVAKPTWFLPRARFEVVGGFDEGGRGTPEDMIFFYRHVDLGGVLGRVSGPGGAPLVQYRHHAGAATGAVHELTLFRERLAALERQVLMHWDGFTIWSAGRLGKRLYRALAPEHQRKVRAFCDVDARKLAHGEYFARGVTPAPVPVVHFSRARPPLVLCVKLDLTGGHFEANLASLGLREGVDYVHFC